jgi:hypothetical protein
MFLRDSYNKLNFLVDSGASLSIIPFSSSQTPFGPKLLGANGTSIPTWGFQIKTSKIGTNTFEHEFLTRLLQEVSALHSPPAMPGIG